MRAHLQVHIVRKWLFVSGIRAMKPELKQNICRFAGLSKLSARISTISGPNYFTFHFNHRTFTLQYMPKHPVGESD